MYRFSFAKSHKQFAVYQFGQLPHQISCEISIYLTCSSSRPQVSTSSNQSSLSLLPREEDGAVEAEERREEPQLSMADDVRTAIPKGYRPP